MTLFRGSEKFGNDLPGCAAYLLGFKVLKQLRARYLLGEMAKWKEFEVIPIVTATLRDLAHSNRD